MNSLDPWRVIVTDPAGNVIVPTASYGHPFYWEIPSWINYGDGGSPSTTRQLFDGVFIAGWSDSTGDNMSNIGAQLTALSPPGYGFYRPFGFRRYGGVFLGAEEPPRRTGLTAELAPVLAPATGGITVKKELDDKQVLHVEICVDGKCYRQSMDLAPAIAMVMQKIKVWHESQHAPPPPPSTVVSTVSSAVGAAEDLIVGALVARHVDTVCGSFLGDIAGAVGGAVSGIAGGVASTFKALKGPIGAAAGIAAASGAALIPGVGPIAAPIAGKLANDLVQAAAGDTKAKKAVQQANQQAKTDPAVAVALQQAKKAVANSTAAHHVQEVAKKAARGDSTAQQQIVKVADDAQQGDPAAKAVADLVANAMKSEWGAKLWERVTGPGPSTISGWYDIVVGAATDDLRERARGFATRKPGNAAGVIQMADRTFHARGFPSLDDAIDWLQRSTGRREDFLYAAAYEKGSDGTAYIQAEEFGGPRTPSPGGELIPREAPAVTSGWY
jgi:hypothetical protein